MTVLIQENLSQTVNSVIRTHTAFHGRAEGLAITVDNVRGSATACQGPMSGRRGTSVTITQTRYIGAVIFCPLTSLRKRCARGRGGGGGGFFVHGAPEHAREP